MSARPIGGGGRVALGSPTLRRTGILAGQRFRDPSTDLREPAISTPRFERPISSFHCCVVVAIEIVVVFFFFLAHLFLGESRSMAAEAESVRLEEVVRRGIAFFPLFYDVVGTDGTASEPERFVIFNPLNRRVIVLQSDPGMMHSLMPSDPEADGPPPASKASIEALRVVDPEENGAEEECPMCLEWLRGHEAAAEEEVVREMPCGHRFHGRCIEKWLGMHGSCPLCRYQMPVAEEEPKKVGGEEGPRSRELLVTITFGRLEGDVSEQRQEEEQREECLYIGAFSPKLNDCSAV